jgi:hypothetical protein
MFHVHTHINRMAQLKKKHRHIIEMGLSLLAHACMPLKFWDEAFSTTTYLINHLPSRVIDFSSPYELFDSKPDYNWLKVFGCAYWPHLRPYNIRKLEFRSKRCAFLRYSPCLRATSALTFLQDESIFLVMLCLIRTFSFF